MSIPLALALQLSGSLKDMNKEPDEVASVTLIILGDDLEPGYVSDLLGMKPSQSWRKGEEKRKAKGTFYEWGGWKCFSEDNSNVLEEQLESWLLLLERKAAAFRQMKENGWKCCLDCFLAFDDVSTVCIPSELSERTGELGLDLVFCLNSNDAESKQVGLRNSGKASPSRNS